MSVANGRDYLYLIWRSNITREQEVVAELSKNGQYEFEYREGVKKAIEEGFTPLVAFPDITKKYVSENLFPAITSRLPDKKRPDMDKILKKYGLKEYDPYSLLKRSGARLPIDDIYFVDPILNISEPFERKFYIAGPRYYLACEGKDCSKSMSVAVGDELFLVEEPENEKDKTAIKLVNNNEQTLGYIPRYYSEAYTRLTKEGRQISCRVTQVNKSDNCDECVQVSISVN